VGKEGGLKGPQRIPPTPPARHTHTDTHPDPPHPHPLHHPSHITTPSDPMRITKKFSGVGSIGKCVFHPRDPPNPDKAARAMREIEALEVSQSG
jgi:hypothetical protein